MYGGGNGVTVYGSITVFLNVKDPVAYDHVGTIFGGNNEDNVVEFENVPLVPDIILLHGQVGTIYGGCNKGAMTTGKDFTIDGTTYSNVGSMVRLRSTYQATPTAPVVIPDASVSNAVYGGCRMNDVYYNTLVLVDGGDHPATFFGGSDVSGNVGGTSQVFVTGGSTGAVYGGGNGDYSGYGGTFLPPYCDSTHVELLGGSTGSVFGGGYAGECGDTYLKVGGSSVNGSAFGGGNRAGVINNSTSHGNSTVEMTDGTVSSGIYGGCNSDGAIEGDVEMNIMGGTIGSSGSTANIHGGGYGQATTVDGDILVNFGDKDTCGAEDASEFPKLFGSLYGGSALGNVNMNSENLTDVENSTTVNVFNGTVIGNIYGGGLGYKDVSNPENNVAAMVYGEVHVNIGKIIRSSEPNVEPTLCGQATLITSNVFGCNNIYGTPKANVYVDVYSTAHIQGTNTVPDENFAVASVFGGGNLADYAPIDLIDQDSVAADHTNNLAHLNRTHVYIHGCENTIRFVYGGSNAANALGVQTIIEGGRFDEVYGGGNGQIDPANIGPGSIGIKIHAGHVGLFVEGNNKQGYIDGHAYVPENTPDFDCGVLIIDSYFFGDNEAEHIGDLVSVIECGNSEFDYKKNVYAGSRYAVLYGDISLTVRGGYIERLFGGSKGYNDDINPTIAAHVRKYPTLAQAQAYAPGYSQAVCDTVIKYPALAGTGGNIYLRIEGGVIGNVYGGCDVLGNVEGKITVIVEHDETLTCPFMVGNVYGASNMTDYAPTGNTVNSPTPDVKIIKGTIGGESNFNIYQTPRVFEGNVFGGGNIGNVTSNPKVHIGPEDGKAVHVKGSVYGGGNEGNIDGSPNVIVGPTE